MPDVIRSYYIITCSAHPTLSWKRWDNDSFAGKLDLSLDLIYAWSNFNSMKSNKPLPMLNVIVLGCAKRSSFWEGAVESASRTLMGFGTFN